MFEKWTEIKFLGSFPNVAGCPAHRLHEFAFIGRSNVGKSSLINYLSNHSTLAKTSKKPGKTQLINLFAVDDAWCMVDLPGYGYAVTSKKMRVQWKKMIYDYLEKRRNLANTFVLLDSRHPLQKIDLEFINWLGSRGIPFSIIYTKTDAVPKTKLGSHISLIRDELLGFWEELPPEFITSAVSQQGREEILSYIYKVITMLNQENE